MTRDSLLIIASEPLDGAQTGSLLSPPSARFAAAVSDVRYGAKGWPQWSAAPFNFAGDTKMVTEAYSMAIGEVQTVKLPVPFVYHDLVLDKVIKFKKSEHYFTLSIGNRDIFFNLDGTMDGTGSCAG